VTRVVDWRPNSTPQSAFVGCGAYEALYGGAAGGGKSDALLCAALRWVHEPNFRAILFRRTFPELERSLIDRSRRYFRGRATYNESRHVWEFPSGARIFFGYLEADEDVHLYQSAEYSYIAFDELTHFSEAQFRYMLSRARGSNHIRIRAGTNPGGIGHDWVQKRWGPWLAGADWEGPRAEPGEVLWYVNAVGCHCFETTAEDEVERYVPKGHKPRCPHDLPFSRTFIPARAEDNPANNASYVAQLGALDALTRAQLRDGNWLIRAAPGLLFKRSWFRWLDVAPVGFKWVRWWDRAATDPDPKKHNDPDWTVGVKLGIGPDKALCVGDVVRLRATPQVVKATIRATAELDGPAVKVTGGKDPGAAGVFEEDEYVRALGGFNVKFWPETGDKVVRAGPISAQCEAGNVSLVRGAWNEPFLQCLENFPTKGYHDDDVDAFSGAYEALAGHFAPTYEGVPKVAQAWYPGRRLSR
jgi:predicted phage terminase large subunit-like protein